MSRRPRGAQTDTPRGRGPASMDSRLDSLPDVTLQHLTSHDCAVDVALRIDAKAFRTGMIGACRLHVLDERRHRAVSRAANPNPLLDPGQLVRAGVGS